MTCCHRSGKRSLLRTAAGLPTEVDFLGAPFENGTRPPLHSLSLQHGALQKHFAMWRPGLSNSQCVLRGASASPSKPEAEVWGTGTI